MGEDILELNNITIKDIKEAVNFALVEKIL